VYVPSGSHPTGFFPYRNCTPSGYFASFSLAKVSLKVLRTSLGTSSPSMQFSDTQTLQVCPFDRSGNSPYMRHPRFSRAAMN